MSIVAESPAALPVVRATNAARSASRSVSGDVAYTMGRFRVHYEPPCKPPVEVGGRYVAVWKRFGMEWRIAVLSAHQHKPMPDVPGRGDNGVPNGEEPWT